MTKDSPAGPFLMLAMSALFVTGSVFWVLVTKDKLAWGGLLFSGACTAVAIAMLFPNHSGWGRTDRSYVDSMILQFPGPVRLRPSRRKCLISILGLLAMAAATIIAMRYPGFGGRLLHPIVGIPSILFMAWLIIRGTLKLLPGESALVLDRDGFELAKYFRTSHTSWKDTSEFKTLYKQMLGSPTAYGIAFDKACGSKMHSARQNRQLPDTYGLSAENLTSLMNQWRERALQAKG
jgi:hypothetical protein